MTARIARRVKTKYGAVRTVVDGITFHSRAEARHYDELKLRLKAGEIRDLELQPRYPLKVNGKLVCTYVGDFRFVDTRTGATVLEDVKGKRTDVFILKKKLLAACLGVDIVEVKA